MCGGSALWGLQCVGIMLCEVLMVCGRSSLWELQYAGVSVWDPGVTWLVLKDVHLC